MTRIFSKSFRESLRKSKNSVELAGSGVTNVFPSTRKLTSAPSNGAKWLRHYAIYFYHRGRGESELAMCLGEEGSACKYAHTIERAGWSPDKGSEENELQRQKNKTPALVATGK